MLFQRFEWDVKKSAANARARGFDFEFASMVFDGFTVEVEDRRRDYGERRVIALGVAGGIELTVVYTDRKVATGEIVRRIMSGRRSNRREQAIYQKAAETKPSEAGSGGSRMAT